MNTPKIHIQILGQGQIQFVLADKNYSVFHLENGRKFVSGYSLKFHETFLDVNQFLRVNRSILVNMTFIASIKDMDKSSYVVLQNGEIIPIPRRRLKSMQAQYPTLRLFNCLSFG